MTLLSRFLIGSLAQFLVKKPGNKMKTFLGWLEYLGTWMVAQPPLQSHPNFGTEKRMEDKTFRGSFVSFHWYLSYKLEEKLIETNYLMARWAYCYGSQKRGYKLNGTFGPRNRNGYEEDAKPQKTEICKTETLLLYKKEGNEMDIGPGVGKPACFTWVWDFGPIWILG